MPLLYTIFKEVYMSEKVIILHGFSREEIFKISGLLKQAFKGEDIILATTTPTSLQWKMSQLIDELKKEHEYFRKKGR